MVNIDFKDKYLGVTTPTELRNEVSKCRKMYYDKEIRVMVDKSVNYFYTCFLLKHYELPQEFLLPLDIVEKLSNNLSPEVRYFLI